VRHAVGAVTHRLCRRHSEKMCCVAAQRLVGYAENAHPPYIYDRSRFYPDLSRQRKCVLTLH
jgi:hypothetical protein